MTYTCPVDAGHDTFAQTHRETVVHLLTADGEFIEELSNSYDSDGYEGDVWCRDCDRAGVETLVQTASAGPDVGRTI